jgi:hypothetical protein
MLLTGKFTIHAHPTLHDTTILCTPNGRAVTTLSSPRVRHLFQLYRPDLTQHSFVEEVYHLITRLGSRSEIHSPSPATTTRNIWATREDLLTTLRNTFHTQTKLYSYPLYKSLNSHTYHSQYPEEIVFSSSGCNAPHTWHGTNIANLEYDHKCMRRAIERAITSAHSTASHTPIATILILPRWGHTPYRHSKYIASPYTHHL